MPESCIIHVALLYSLCNQSGVLCKMLCMPYICMMECVVNVQINAPSSWSHLSCILLKNKILKTLYDLYIVKKTYM